MREFGGVDPHDTHDVVVEVVSPATPPISGGSLLPLPAPRAILEKSSPATTPFFIARLINEGFSSPPSPRTAEFFYGILYRWKFFPFLFFLSSSEDDSRPPVPHLVVPLRKRTTIDAEEWRWWWWGLGTMRCSTYISCRDGIWILPSHPKSWISSCSTLVPIDFKKFQPIVGRPVPISTNSGWSARDTTFRLTRYVGKDHVTSWEQTKRMGMVGVGDGRERSILWIILLSILVVVRGIGRRGILPIILRTRRIMRLEGGE